MPASSRKEHGDSSCFEMREDKCVIQCDVLAKCETVFHLAGQKHYINIRRKGQNLRNVRLSVCMANKKGLLGNGAF